MLNKKGMTHETVVKLAVLLMATVILILVLTVTLGPRLFSVSNVALCKISVEFKARLNSVGVGQFMNTPLFCKSNPVFIDKISTPHKVEKTIATEMYNCWYQFGEGKINFLKKFSFNRYGLNCFLCSKIDFSEDLTNGQVNLWDYLKDTKIPAGDQTYLQYFTSSKNPISQDLNIKDLGNLDKVPLNKPVYIYYIAKLNPGWEQLTNKEGLIFLGEAFVAGFVAGTAATSWSGPGAILGGFMAAIPTAIGTTIYHEKAYQGVFIFNSEEVKKICQ
ncbi:MAG: hypothetical protein WC413_03490 [Candidatus Nanoarchaeia archaeon]